MIMSYGKWHAIFEVKVKHYTEAICDHAIKDCHETLKLHPDMHSDDPYCIKLWAEIDALRERKIKIKPYHLTSC